MSWAAVRPVLVSIVGAVVPTIKRQGLPAKFRHDDNGDEANPIGDSRRYWLISKSGNAIGHVWPTTTRYKVSVDVVVEYVFDVDSSTMDMAIVEDAVEIIRALADGSAWQRPNSTIIAVSPSGDVVGLRITIEVEFYR